MKKFSCTVPRDRLAHGLADRCGQNHCFADPPLHEGAFPHQVTCWRYLLQQVVFLVVSLKLVFTRGVWGNPRVKLVTTVTVAAEAGQIVDHNIFFYKPPTPPTPPTPPVPAFSPVLQWESRLFSKVGGGVVELVERLNTGLSIPPP